MPRYDYRPLLSKTRPRTEWISLRGDEAAMKYFCGYVAVRVMPAGRGDPQPSAGERPEVVRIGFIPYLRAMLNLVWSAFRHPTKTTEIDLMTGRIVRHF